MNFALSFCILISHFDFFMAHYIFIIGGVMSGIGKGVVTTSIGKILQARGYKVTAMKIDPYINVDAGTMNPIEHGEIFVTDDGLECDQDIGNYERFLEENLSADNYITTGRIYQTIINKERKLEYKGKCVEVIPHIPNEVIKRIKQLGRVKENDFVLIEIGGTAGEYQNSLFLEAARIMKIKMPNKVLINLVSYFPVLHILGEMKTKPTQHAIQLLNMAGIQPDFILARATTPLDKKRKIKIATVSNIPFKNIISVPDRESIYEIPLILEEQGLSKKILRIFNLKSKGYELKKWESLVNNIHSPNKKTIKIGIIGKYFKSGRFTLQDVYISIIEAIKHAAWNHNLKPKISWLSAEDYEKKSIKQALSLYNEVKKIKNYHGIIVPGGFGERGTAGKIEVIKFCRENKIPFLGICLGMQLAIIEFAQNVCNLKQAHSTEFFPNTKFPLISTIQEQKKLLKNKQYGATMRLGSYDCQIKPNTIADKSYSIYFKNIEPYKNAFSKKKKNKIVSERHRHRYELNNIFKKTLEKHGLVISGINPEKKLVEIIEVPDHPFFVGVQFHPEFKSRPLNPHPLFKEFIKQGSKNID